MLLLLSLLGLLIAGWWQDGDEGDQMAQQEIQRLLKLPAYQGVTLTRAEGGTLWALEGYIQENKQRLELQSLFERNGILPRMELRSMEELRQNAEFILQRQGLGQLKVVSGSKAGWLRLTGALPSATPDLAALPELLKREVPGLLGVENRVDMAGSQRKRLDALLEEHSLKQLAIREVGDRIELRGALDETQLIFFSQLQQAFRQEFGNQPRLELINRSRKSSQDEFEFDVKAVSLGKVPYVVLANNQRYPIGAATSDGVRILAIRRDAVVVKKGQQEYVIRFNGEQANDPFGGATAQR